MIGVDQMEEVPTAVLCSERCHLGEGPSYDAATDTAWWFDIVERRLFEARLDTGQTTIHSLDVMGSALGRIDAHRQLLVADDGLYIRDAADGRMALYRPLEADNAATRSNDARVHPSGTFWIGTMGRQAERGFGAIYALYREQPGLHPEVLKETVEYLDAFYDAINDARKVKREFTDRCLGR